jgi:acyl carrier protein
MIDDFIKNFKLQFEDENFDLYENTEFRHLDGWDSMTSLMIVAMFDDVYNTSISSEELEKAQTILDLYNLIK